jgi:hypothetical protein
MCNVSMIMDTWSPHIPQPNEWVPRTVPQFPQQIPINVPPDPAKRVAEMTVDELRKLLAAFHNAVAAAETFDRLTGQPDCIDAEKAKLVDRVAELERKIEEMSR